MYSMFSASPVIYPPHGPMAVLANEYAPPVCGNAGDISAIEKQRPAYIAVMMIRAVSMPEKPPAMSPKFQPKKSPEMTAATPRAHKCNTRAWRRRVRFSKYSVLGFEYTGKSYILSEHRLKPALQAEACAT